MEWRSRRDRTEEQAYVSHRPHSSIPPTHHFPHGLLCAAVPPLASTNEEQPGRCVTDRVGDLCRPSHAPQLHIPALRIPALTVACPRSRAFGLTPHSPPSACAHAPVPSSRVLALPGAAGDLRHPLGGKTGEEGGKIGCIGTNGAHAPR